MANLPYTKDIIIIKADGSRESFEPEKLRTSLIHSGATDREVENVLQHILPELHDNMTTSEIYKHAFSVLNKTDKPVARSYSLRRAVMDLGPSGFPFEKFIAEILKAKGFECLTGQTLLGGCVSHEVDVVAWDKEKLLVVEAKFHNELGTKSDLKVALYIKARFDDLRGNVYDYGGKGRKITDSWLVTNTKFSSTALHYGVCQGLVLIGWNYPEKGNLQDMIESESLHPITCLTSLSMKEKKTLLTEGLVMCKDFKTNPGLLTQFLGKDFDASYVLDEIKVL